MFRTLILVSAFWIPCSLLSQGIFFSENDTAARGRIVHDVSVLTSDSLLGREAGTKSEGKTARYLSDQFRAIGLIPKGDENGSYLQKFSKIRPAFKWTTRLTVNGVSYKYQEAFGVTALSENGKGHGQLLDGLQGLVIPELAMDQLSGLGDLKGSFVLINLQVPDSLLKDTALVRKLTPRYRMQSALNKGVKGVIFWNPDSRGMKELFDFESADTLPGISLFVKVRTAMRFIRQAGSMAEVEVHIDRKTSVYSNVIGFLDNHASHSIIVGAHFDHLGVKKDGKIFSGADDNASGTAGMLELARYFASHRDTLNNFLFIGFTAEEKGLWGSEYFISHPTLALSGVKFMLNLDMIGRLGCEGNILEIEAAGSSPAWREILRKTRHPDFSIKLVRASLPYSDHEPFYQAMIPVLFFNTGLHDDYHTTSDTKGTLNYNGMVEILKFAEGVISNSGRESQIPYRKVPWISQLSATLGYAFQAMGWVFTIH